MSQNGTLPSDKGGELLKCGLFSLFYLGTVQKSTL